MKNICKHAIIILLSIALFLCVTQLSSITVFAVSSDLPEENGDGVIKLNDDVTLSSGYRIYNEKKIDLNGYTLKAKSGDTFQVDAGGKLIIYDSSTNKTGNLSNQCPGYNYSPVVLNGGEVVFSSGNITNSNYYAVRMVSGTFNMYGGKISAYSSSGFWVDGGTLNMSGGAICNCYSSGLYITEGTVNLENATISDNGNEGIYVMNLYNCALNLYGGLHFKDNALCDISLDNYNSKSRAVPHINIKDKLTGEPIGIKVIYDTNNPSDEVLPIILTKGLSKNGDLNDFVCKQGDDYKLLIDENGELILAKKTDSGLIWLHSNYGTDKAVSVSATKDSADNLYKAVLPTNVFARDYYSFKGWCEFRDGTGNSYNDGVSVAFTAGKQLYAKWQPEIYNITYDLGVGKLKDGEENPTNYTVEDSFTLHNPEADHYIFTGWTGADLDEITTQADINYGSHGDRAYKANWKIKKYKVSFESFGGTKIQDRYVDACSKLVLPPDPTNDFGYFGGWCTDYECKMPFDISTEIKEDTILYAKWLKSQPETYSILYDLGMGYLNAGIENPSNYSSDMEFTLNNPVADDYDFTGWTGTDLAEKTMQVSVPKGSSGFKYFTANWEIKKYEVIFNTDGGTAVDSQTVKIHEKAVKPSDPIKDGFNFGGWYTNAELTAPFDFSMEVTRDVTIYAKWLKNESNQNNNENNNQNNGETNDQNNGGTNNQNNGGTNNQNNGGTNNQNNGGTSNQNNSENNTSDSRDKNDICPSRPALTKTVEKAILNATNDNDQKGSTFTLLKAKGVAKSDKSITLSWSKIKGAKKYIIYGNKCGKKNKYKKLATVKGTSYTAKKLKKGTYYKFIIVAVNGTKTLATSKTIHVTTNGGKNSNHTKAKLSKTKLTLKKGKSGTIKVTLKSGSKKVAIHRKVAWESENIKVAKVNKNGKITAVGKGSCYIYAYTQNGIYARVKVIVK